MPPCAGTIVSRACDNYARDWVAGAWRKLGFEYNRSPQPKGAIYLESLPVFTRGLARLPDHARLVRELRLLERRTHERRLRRVPPSHAGRVRAVGGDCVADLCWRAAQCVGRWGLVGARRFYSADACCFGSATGPVPPAVPDASSMSRTESPPASIAITSSSSPCV
jgi:hypothetical protein